MDVRGAAGEGGGAVAEGVDWEHCTSSQSVVGLSPLHPNRLTVPPTPRLHPRNPSEDFMKEANKLYRSVRAHLGSSDESDRRKAGVAVPLRNHLMTHPIWHKVFEPMVQHLENVVASAMSLDLDLAPAAAQGRWQVATRLPVPLFTAQTVFPAPPRSPGTPPPHCLCVCPSSNASWQAGPPARGAPQWIHCGGHAGAVLPGNS